VLREEELILVAVVGGSALLILGILELIWPSTPRHPVRRPQPARAPPPPPAKTPTPARTAAPAMPLRERRSQVSPHARPHAGSADRVGERVSFFSSVLPFPIEGLAAPVLEAEAERLPEPVVAAEAPPEPPPEPSPAPLPASSPEPAPTATGRADLLLVERCFSLYEDRRYDEVVSVGEEALARLRDTPLSTPQARTTAALWAVVALAKQALGDDVGASVALESALGVAPAEERVMYQQDIAALSYSAAQAALARAGSSDTDDRVAEVRRALAWSERGLGAVPSDGRLREMRETARAAIWPAYEQSVRKLLQRREFRVARRLLREALEDPEIPAARVGPFEELLLGTLGGEIGQLTAQAIQRMQAARDSEALAALRREAGDYEDTLDPLVRALKLGDIGTDRQVETRAKRVRAVEGVAGLRPLPIRQLPDADDRDEAVRTETLRERLRSCMDQLGLSAEELAVAFAKIQRLCEELGMEDRVRARAR
jgi:tetratricopeptide (TPR) repeat protein